MDKFFDASDLIWLRLSLHKGDSMIFYVIDKKDEEKQELELLMEYSEANEIFRFFKDPESIELAISDWLSDSKNSSVVDISDHVIKDDFIISSDEIPLHSEGKQIKTVFRVNEIMEKPF